MTHTDLLASWAQYLTDDRADYLLLMPADEEGYIFIPADKAILFASLEPLTMKQRKAYGIRGADLGALTVVVVEGPPTKCVKTLIHIKDEAQ